MCSCFNGCLTSVARDNSCYIVCHDGIVASMGKGLCDHQNPSDLSQLVLSMFLADIVLLSKHIYKPFQVAQEARQLPFCMSGAFKLKNMDTAVKSLHIDG